MRISDWSSDVCSSDLYNGRPSNASRAAASAPRRHVTEESPMSAQPQTSQGPNLGMTVTTFENPMGIDGFEFVEFAAPEGQGEAMRDYFARMGFTAVLSPKRRTTPVDRDRQSHRE